MLLDQEDEEAENFNIIGDYKVIRLVGRGTFSKVYEGRVMGTQERVALKILPKGKVKFDSLTIFETELDTLMRLSAHENVLRLVDAFETLDRLVIVTEFCDGGDLFGLLRERVKLSELECKMVLRGALMGLAHVHGKHRVCHRDLKLENILLTSAGRVVIGDFGLSKSYNSLLLTRCGSEEYAAPEVILGKPYAAEKSDVWGFGVIMFACLKGRLPFLRHSEIKVNSGNPLSLYAQILSKNVVLEGDFVSPHCQRVLSRALDRDASRRATFEELLALPFFNNLDLDPDLSS